MRCIKRKKIVEKIMKIHLQVQETLKKSQESTRLGMNNTEQ